MFTELLEAIKQYPLVASLVGGGATTLIITLNAFKSLFSKKSVRDLESKMDIMQNMVKQMLATQNLFNSVILSREENADLLEQYTRENAKIEKQFNSLFETIKEEVKTVSRKARRSAKRVAKKALKLKNTVETVVETRSVDDILGE